MDPLSPASAAAKHDFADEAGEYDAYIEAGDLIAALQLKAREQLNARG